MYMSNFSGFGRWKDSIKIFVGFKRNIYFFISTEMEHVKILTVVTKRNKHPNFSPNKIKWYFIRQAKHQTKGKTSSTESRAIIQAPISIVTKNTSRQQNRTPIISIVHLGSKQK